MKRTAPIRSTDELAASFAEAQAKASVMAGAPAQWNANTERRYRRSSWGTLCALAIAAFMALGFLLADPGRDETAADRALPATAPLPTSLDSKKADQSYQTEWALPSARASEASSDARAHGAKSNRIVRQGTFVEIVFEGIPLADAVASLGAATGGRVHGAENLASVTRLVNLHWQGTGLEAAWSALLSPVANAAVACGPRSCDVWIVGVGGNAASSQGARVVVDDAAALARAGSQVIGAMPPAAPMRALTGPQSRRNDGPLEAPSSD